MPTTYTNAQIVGTAGLTTYATLYNTAVGTTAVISTISICNRSTANKQYRIGLMGSAGTPGTAEFIAFDATVAPNDTSFITVGITMRGNQFLRVSSTDTNVTFGAYIAEVT